MPENDDHETGYKFPFNACEILQSENNFILDKIFESVEEVEFEDANQRKLSEDSHEAYRDDHSMEESEESGEEYYAHHDDAIIKQGNSNNETEIESKNINSDHLINENQTESEERLVDKENSEISQNENLNHMAHSEGEATTEKKFDDRENIYIIQHADKDTERSDEEILNEIGKKIQNLKIEAGIEQVVVDGDDILIENNEDEQIVVDNGSQNVENTKDNQVMNIAENRVKTDNPEYNDVIDSHDIIIEEKTKSSDEEEIKHEILIDEQIQYDDEANYNYDIIIEDPINNYQEIVTQEDSKDNNEYKVDNGMEQEVFYQTKEEKNNDENVNHQVESKPVEVEYEEDCNFNFDDIHEKGTSDDLIETEHKSEKETLSKEEEEKDPSTNVRHKVIPRHQKHQSTKHEFFTEEDGIFNISNENIRTDSHINTPVKEVYNIIILSFSRLKSDMKL